MLRSEKYIPLCIFLVGALFFIPFLGSVHLFDWDEINFAESAREMLLTGNYMQVQIDFQPFTEKPPLFFWLQALSMQVFGVGEFAARFPNAITGIIVLLTLYYSGKKLKDTKLGLLWAGAYFGALLPHLYFKSGIIDPVFNFFMFLAIRHLYQSTLDFQGGKFGILHPVLSGIFTGLAILTKGPVGFLVVFLSFAGYWMSQRFRPVARFSQVAGYALSTLLVSALWYGPETIQNGPVFLKEFIIRQIEIFTTNDAGHGQPFYYHFVVLLIGCFPVSIIALSNIFGKRNSFIENSDQFRTWMLSTLAVVLTVFSISTTKIVHYSSMAYYPLSYLAALEIYRWTNQDQGVRKWVIFSGYFIGFMLGFLMILLSFIDRYKDKIIPFIKDPFAVANLNAEVHWSGLEWLLGVFFILGTGISWWWLYKQRIIRGATGLFAVTAITVMLFGLIFVPRIESYTQGANIRFFQSLKGQKVYAGTVWYKSYAPLFYTDKQAEIPPFVYFEELLHKDVGMPVYLSVKNIHKERMEAHPEFELIGEENGFVFYQRSQMPPDIIK
ncbi:MAG: glycosyltransferase family 39 protein [Saprospiraceae bacterium]|nr:glycosyltransferase family 39 protein [Saprospiraceae bacterium]